MLTPSLVIREMQSTTIMRYYLTPTIIAILKRWTITNVSEDMEKLEPSYVAGENVK